MEFAFKAAGKGGQVLLFGVAAPETVISVSPFEIFSKELTVKGSFVNPYTHEEAIALISKRNKKYIDVQQLISHRFTLWKRCQPRCVIIHLGFSKGVMLLVIIGLTFIVFSAAKISETSHIPWFFKGRIIECFLFLDLFRRN